MINHLINAWIVWLKSCIELKNANLLNSLCLCGK